MNNNRNLSVFDRGFGPLSELHREVDRLFSDFWPVTTYLNRPALGTKSIGSTMESDWHPACDVKEEEDHFLLTFDMPGVPQDQINIRVDGNQLMVSGERRQDQKVKTDGIWHTERQYGKFLRSFTLPTGIESEDIEANYRDGILEVFVPKSEVSKPRQIKITNGDSTGFFKRLTGRSPKTNHEEMAS